MLVDFARDRSGAIAPLYALALFGLIMIAGVGWDYSRMATMDSELQNAADQAALAAATQLDGRADAMQRAEDAATSYLATAGSAWANETKLANEKNNPGRTISLASFEFFQTWPNDQPGPIADSDSNARYVRVTVDGREAFYALTSIGGLISSGLIGASAVATLEAAACNVPPLMVCAPSGNSGFPTTDDIGIALDLREGPLNSSEFTPGNFDLLNIPYVGLTASEKNLTLGLNSDLLGCTGDPVRTSPGQRTPQNRAINTRFGIYGTGAGRLRCDADGNFCPGDLTRHDPVRKVSVKNGFDTATCDNTAGGELIAASDVPVSPAVPDQGFPLDTCQTDGSTRCLSFGDGVWPVTTYMQNVHGTSSTTGLDMNLDGRTTRYDVYNWERALASRTESRELSRVPDGNNSGTLYCTAPDPIEGTAVLPSDSQKDRRVLTVAVVDCAGQSGSFDVNSFKFVDMFLLSPMVDKGSGRELKAEIIGPARRADGGSGFQTFGRKKPVLVQ